jgi:hypothetical protein
MNNAIYVYSFIILKREYLAKPFRNATESILDVVNVWSEKVIRYLLKRKVQTAFEVILQEELW